MRNDILIRNLARLVLEWIEQNFDDRLFDLYENNDQGSIWYLDRIIIIAYDVEIKLWPTDRYSKMKEKYLNAADPDFFIKLEDFLVNEWQLKKNQ